MINPSMAKQFASSDTMQLTYADFLESKVITHSPCGFDANLSQVEWLKPFQQKVVELSLHRGKAAVFAGIGLGKTRMQLAWADLVCRTANTTAMIFVPLAVAPQTVDEGAKLKGAADDLGIAVNVCRSQADVKPGINISNYEKMHLFDASTFGAIVLDESSVLKGYSSATREMLGEFAANIPYRLACTATPAPNDLLEIINHAEWLGVMNGREAIANFFVQDGNTTQKYRLKKTCTADFWRWVASWAVCVRKPSDLGDYSDEGYDLPELRIHEVEVESDRVMTSLLPIDTLDMTERRAMRKESLNYRVAATANLVNSSTDKWVVWCDYNDESDALRRAIPDAAEIRGSMTTEQKEKAIADFTWGDRRVLISKASMTGFGLNWQHCHKTAFVGVSDSWEQQYQAIGRFYRFGQQHPVDVYMVASLQESVVTQNLKRKQAQSDEFYDSVRKYMQQALEGKKKVRSTSKNGFESGANWELYLGDNVKRIKEIADDSIGSIITSIPFPGMYAYTDLPEDMGNTTGYEEFTNHISFLVPELLRVLKPGRSACVHLTQGIAMKSRDGHMGLKDFRGDMIRLFQQFKFVYAGEVTIQKDPQMEAIRNNTHGLLFKSLSTDASIMRMCTTDYVVIFRKPGKNAEPIKAGKSDKYNPGGGWITEEEWIEWADGVWYRHIAPDGKIAAVQPYHPALTRKAEQKGRGGESLNGISVTDVLNVSQARDVNDERHLCLAKGTLILTKEGYKPIELVSISDLVLTHMGRWRRVTAKQCTGVRPVVQVKAQGVPNLALTPDHKLWTRGGKGDRHHSRQKAMKAEPSWVRSDETAGSYINLKLPPIETTPSLLNEKEWRIVGRWLADGHISERNTIHVSCGNHKLESLIAMLGDRAGSIYNPGTAHQILVRDPDGRLRKTLSECGHGAANKRLPSEAFTLPVILAKALLEGYLSGDGHYLKSRDKWMASSVSRELLLGIAILAQRVFGTVASVYAGRGERLHTIEGRVVHAKQDWALCFNATKDTSAFIADDGAWKKVRSTDSAGEVETWSLQVEEDESYTAENCIVKNCPLQMGVIERCGKLFSNPGDIILDPFNGIGSSGVKAIEIERKYVGIELKESYFKSAVKNLKSAESGKAKKQLTIFDSELVGAL